jgi:predicted O-methyltransferase YrrM
VAALRGAVAIGNQRSLKETIKHVMPQLVHLVRLGRLMANQVRYPVAATMLDWRGTVVDGPFMGMRYVRSGMAKFAQVLGTYERSLIQVVERVIDQQPRVIIDVGAAYGYYALGFAWRCPGSQVIAYELDDTRLDLIRKYCRLNGVEDHVETRSECTVASLVKDLGRSPGAFLFMDAEGAEDVLLQPDIANIEQSEMLVELHEMFAPGVTRRLRERFARTHMSSVIPQAALQAHPDNANWFIRSFWRELNREDRGQPMTWLHLVPRVMAHPE